MAKRKPIRKNRSRSAKTVKVRRKSAVIFSSAKYSPSIKQFFNSLQNEVATRKNEFTNFVKNQFSLARVKLTHAPVKTKKKVALSPRQKSHQKPILSPKLTPKLAKNWDKKKKAAQKKLKVLASAFYQHLLYPFWYVARYHWLLTLICLLFSGLILGSAYMVNIVIFKDLPSVSELATRKQILTTKILDRNHQLLYRIYKDENRTLIPLTQVPQHMINATVAIEDRNFYSHRGISFRGIVRALRENAQNESLQGGSTITQQLVKNTLLTPERTYKRKIREILLSFILEGTYTKSEILEMYFNQIPYGGSTYGVEEAAQRYFGKSANNLDLAESAFLAGLPASPTVFSPFGSNPEYAVSRQHEVLRRMVEDEYITQEQADQAKKETLTFVADATNIQAPHFVMYVRNLLVQEYGEDLVNQGGLEVTTTLDLASQKQAQQIVTDEVNALNRLRITNGAALITNPQSGEVLAMIGSKNYFDFANDGQVNVTLRPRQPGSSIKPLTYAVALEKGMSPSTMILDAPITFNTAGSPPYTPKNYDGKFHGNVSLREALGSSYNIPAVKTLASVGIPQMIDKGEEMGISTWTDRRRFGLALTLGGGEVLMADMAQVYGTFANYGETVPLNPILEVKNAKGEVLYRNRCALEKVECPTTRTLSAKVAYQITDILSDNGARSPAFGPRSVLQIPNQQVAVKTGTTNNLKDNWAIGYTRDRVVAVWVGNNDGRPMSYVASGVTGASPIWNEIMRTQLDAQKPHAFVTPDGLTKVKICAQTGTLPCRGCPTVKEELFAPGTEPKQACSPSYFQKIKADRALSESRDRILDGVQTSN